LIPRGYVKPVALLQVGFTILSTIGRIDVVPWLYKGCRRFGPANTPANT